MFTLESRGPMGYDGTSSAASTPFVRKGERMDGPAHGSVTHWVNGLAEGDAEASQRLWERYFDRLAGLARARIGRAGVGGAVEDGEDAAASTFYSFYEAARQRRYPDLRDRNNLWRLLVTITSRKVLDQFARRGAEKRGGGHVILGSAADGGIDPIENSLDPGPSPEFAAIYAEELRLHLGSLGDPQLRRVAELHLEGYTIAEIAERIGRSRRMVDIYLRTIRSAWGEEPSDE